MTKTATPLELLRDVFGFPSFRPGQEPAIERLMAGKSVLAVFPTGSGKSLCYQIPALLLPGTTIVVSPLIALMKDQVDVLVRKGVAAARLDSTLTAREAAKVQDDLAAGRLRLLYVAPERLSNERFVQRVKRATISLLAIDEAHCISEWGHNFRPDYLKLARVARELGIERVLALTATATPAVAADVRREFGIAAEDHVQTGFRRPNLDLAVTPCTADERLPRLLDRVRDEPGAAIVYVTLQQTSEDVAGFLAKNGIAAAAYHAGMENDERAKVQEAFMSGATRVVVATIAFGMGIDKSDIRAVFHFNIPKTLENYAQEIGRAGRDGLPSRCEVLACGDDRGVLESFAYGDTPTRESLAALVRSLLAMGDTLEVSTVQLSFDHDIRVLVVSTALTYLELEGTLVHVGPFYSEYKIKLEKPLDKIVGRFDPERAEFLRNVIGAAKVGRTWLTLEIDRAAFDLGEPRERIVAALGYLEEQGDVTVEASGLKQRYRRGRKDARPEVLVPYLDELFRKREERDIARIAATVRFLEQEGCLTRGLLDYFGEKLETDCGQCTSCRSPGGRRIPAPRPRTLGEPEAKTVRELALESHPALATARARARFLVGLSSPAASRARLGRDARFGSFSDVPFATVLAFVESEACSLPVR